jgi:hypothetical protein
MKYVMAILLLISLVTAQETTISTAQLDNTIVALAGKEATVPFPYLSSGDTISGAFKTNGAKKINFYIIKERPGLEAPLDRQYYVSEYTFNSTVPFAKNSTTGENETETTTYLLVFDNTAGTEDVTVYYNAKILKAGESTDTSGGVLDRIRRRP